MPHQQNLPDGLISYGPDANCTLALCPIEATIYEYKPSIAANSIFIALFALSMLIHIIQGVRYKTWGFLAGMVLGCLTEIIGYIGRLILHNNPFSFNGFIIQIVCITFAPVFFSASIYILLYRIVVYLGPQYSRFSPKLFYWIFIPCDLVSLVLQALGGATSSTSTGSNKSGVDISLAGLVFQVFTLTVFIILCVDYAIRYWKRAPSAEKTAMVTSDRKFKLFAIFLSASIIFILIRCAYRIDELSDGYDGPLIRNEALFIVLEGVMVVIAVFCLNVAHPGPIFDTRRRQPAVGSRAVLPSDSEAEDKEKMEV